MNILKLNIYIYIYIYIYISAMSLPHVNVKETGFQYDYYVEMGHTLGQL